MASSDSYSSNTERALMTPHSSETVLVAARVAIHELNQTGHAELAKNSSEEDDFWNRPYAYTIAGPFYEMGGALNFLISRLLRRKRRQSSTPRWMITDEKLDSDNKKTTITVKADQASMSIVVNRISEGNSEVSINGTQTETIEQFMQELNDQLKWRE